MEYSEEIIEHYLRGELSGTELSAFERSMQADPKLRQEVSFQKDILNSIQSFRHQQLKSRLNAIEINTGNGLFSSVYFKFAASIAVVASLVVGTIFWTQSTSNKTTKNTSPAPLEHSSTASVTSETQSVSASQTNSQQTSSVKQTSASKTSAVKSNTKGAQDISSSSVADESIPAIDQTEGINADFEMPDATVGAGNVSVQNIKVNIVKENNLGYRFFNNQLYLHGNFSNSTYELYELNSSPKKQVFLYFENQYYELIQGKTKVTPLVSIKDKSVLDQLNMLRNR